MQHFYELNKYQQKQIACVQFVTQCVCKLCFSGRAMMALTDGRGNYRGIYLKSKNCSVAFDKLEI